MSYVESRMDESNESNLIEIQNRHLELGRMLDGATRKALEGIKSLPDSEIKAVFQDIMEVILFSRTELLNVGERIEFNVESSYLKKTSKTD